LQTPAGPGVRDDSGVDETSEVSIYYDPMISKLAAWGRDRSEAIDRLRRALDEYHVGGIKTTLPFFRKIVCDQEFIKGNLDTGFITRFQERLKSAPDADEPSLSRQRDIVLIAAAIHYAQAQTYKSSLSDGQMQNRWKLSGREASLNAREALDGVQRHGDKRK
jgi:acetyl/propionyl-CoA carboxylase alpha subunit